MLEKLYLGDGVYVEDEGHELKLFTHNGKKVVDVIYLEPQVLDALFEYEKRWKEKPDE